MAGTKDLLEVIAIEVEAKRLERERCLAAVSAGPELPGDMPDEMWDALSNDRDVATEALRIIVRQTKEGIINRIIGA